MYIYIYICIITDIIGTKFIYININVYIHIYINIYIYIYLYYIQYTYHIVLYTNVIIQSSEYIHIIQTKNVKTMTERTTASGPIVLTPNFDPRFILWLQK